MDFIAENNPQMYCPQLTQYMDDLALSRTINLKYFNIIKNKASKDLSREAGHTCNDQSTPWCLLASSSSVNPPPR